MRTKHTKSTGFLSSNVQELGRLCRYGKTGDDGLASLPSALVSRHFLTQAIFRSRGSRGEPARSIEDMNLEVDN